MADLGGKTIFITGGSRGIGEAIAIRAAAVGANIVIAAKTARPHPKLPGTIHTAAENVEKAGGHALPLQVDIRDADAVAAAMEQAAGHFGGIDILVNNASAINLTRAPDTPVKRLDLMLDVNLRGAYICSQACLPYLKQADNPHILTLSPPINLKPKWFQDHTAYTISKYGMSMTVLGLAAELAGTGIGVNALWPRTVIATAAINMLGGRVKPENCRKPEIMADAAYAVLTRPANKTSGRFFIDEEVLREAGLASMDRYAVQPGAPLIPDLFLD
ncbi:MAG TPA: NAD(P)-dependent oxidoreductase [Gammaproteobacteria bacterium]|nr:NAD(P)-dependent oxidoreductase [Gammaproteobacteria bacterium]